MIVVGYDSIGGVLDEFNIPPFLVFACLYWSCGSLDTLHVAFLECIETIVLIEFLAMRCPICY